MADNELNNLSPEQEEAEAKKRSRRRMYTAFILIDIFLAGYIIYAFIMLFTHL